MSGISRAELEEVLESVLSKRAAIDDEIHRKHHEFISTEIDKRKRRYEAWNKFKLSFIGGMALALLGALGWIGSLVLDALVKGVGK